MTQCAYDFPNGRDVQPLSTQQYLFILVTMKQIRPVISLWQLCLKFPLKANTL